MTVNINDSKTLKIIEILIMDPRITCSKVAQLVGLSRAKCGKRIEKILNDGYLQLRPNISRSKYQFYKFMYIKVTNTNEKTLNTFEQSLVRCRNILACYFIEGKYDYLVVVGAESQREFVKTFNTLQQIEGWENSETSTVIRTVKDFELGMQDLK